MLKGLFVSTVDGGERSKEKEEKEREGKQEGKRTKAALHTRQERVLRLVWVLRVFEEGADPERREKEEGVRVYNTRERKGEKEGG